MLFCFTVLLMYFTSVSTAQTMDCPRFSKQCMNVANGCESVWTIVEDVCNISGNSLRYILCHFEWPSCGTSIVCHNIAVVND